MFKLIKIKLSEPICNCKKQNLSWFIENIKGKITTQELKIVCKDCGTMLKVPHEKFVAKFSFDKSYPEGVKTKTKEEIDEEAEMNAAKLKKQEEEAAAKKKQDEEKSLRFVSDLERNAKKNIN